MRKFLRFVRGNAIALLALFLALGGTTYAATALPNNSVGAKQLKANAVTNTKIKNGAVTGAKVADNSVKGADVLESSLGTVPSATNADAATNATNAINATNATTAQGVVDSAITTAKLADGAVTAAKLAAGGVGATKLGTLVERTDSVTIANGAVDFKQVSCLPGERAISGGATTAGVGSTPGWTLRRSSRISGEGWDAAAQNNTGSSGTLIVSVLCLQ
jgi:hypothetical protein